MATTDHTTVYTLFQQALRRPRAPLTAPGPLAAAEDTACARFDLTFEDRVVRHAEYQCTTCVTLIALCESLRQLAMNLPFSDLIEITPTRLLTLHPDIPPSRQSRAHLAIAALKAAFPLS